MSKELNISSEQIENRIFTVRGIKVMLDFHLAELYQVETKRINEQVKRNINRFPEPFMFQLSGSEWDSMRSQIATGYNWSQFATGSQKHRSTMPYVFNEQGVAMLSAVLNSDIAVLVSIQIMNAFVRMRNVLLENTIFSQRLDKIEIKLIDTDHKFEQVFKALESNKEIPPQGVYFEGQVFDAYELSSKIIRSAKESIVLIDNYIDENAITQLAKKAKGVKVLLLTKKTSNQLVLDVKKANEQYGDFDVKQFTGSHDRFLIIDGNVIYHLGASLKDLGKKLFAFSRMDKNSVASIIYEIKGIL